MVRFRRPAAALPAKLDACRPRSRCRCATAKTRTSAPRSMSRPARVAAGIAQARAGAGQGAELQQSQRRRCGARAGRRVPRRGADGRHRQARQPVRRRDARRCWSTPGEKRWPATAFRRSAASSPSTARSTRETAEAITQIFTEVVVAPDADEEARAIFAAQEESAAAADRRTSRPGARRADAGDHRRRPAGPGPRQWHGSAATSSNA